MAEPASQLYIAGTEPPAKERPFDVVKYIAGVRQQTLDFVTAVEQRCLARPMTADDRALYEQATALRNRLEGR